MQTALRLQSERALVVIAGCAFLNNFFQSQYPETRDDWSRESRESIPFLGRTASCACEGTATTNYRTTSSAPSPPVPPSPLSWFRKTLWSLSLASLPLPRLVSKNDPDVTLPRTLLRQRQRDEHRVQQLQQQLMKAIQVKDNQEQVGKLLKEMFEVLYGADISPSDRQEFLERYGCTGWTDEAFNALIELAAERGIVEIGAGNGQWARYLNDYYNENIRPHQPLASTKMFDFVLAFDNQSELPLKPDVYHSRTQPYRDYFYDKVQPCDSIERTLKQWQCRGRVLLLIYPSPGDMAVQALQAYMDADAPTSSPVSSKLSILHNDTVVFVGEGRGGANANDTFFDILESGEWMLCKVLPVRPFGTKGYERMLVLKRVVVRPGSSVLSVAARD